VDADRPNDGGFLALPIPDAILVRLANLWAAEFRFSLVEFKRRHQNRKARQLYHRPCDELFHDVSCLLLFPGCRDFAVPRLDPIELAAEWDVAKG
jgi:hypothetical protein